MTAEAPPATVPPNVLTTPSTTITPPPSLARRFVRHRGAVVGLAILATIVLVAIIGPRLAPFNPYLSNPQAQLLPPQPGHIFGTDDLGRQ